MVYFLSPLVFVLDERSSFYIFCIDSANGVAGGIFSIPLSICAGRKKFIL